MVVDRSPAVSKEERRREEERGAGARAASTFLNPLSPFFQGELLRVNFNVSFPALSCEFLTLDVSDALGTKRLNITKTVRKLPLKSDGERAGFYMHDDLATAPVIYDAPGAVAAAAEDDVYDKPIDAAHFHTLVAKFPVVVINFYAPWCPWCQRLEPTWDAVVKEAKARYPEADGRLRLAKVDCTVEVALCREHQITGFPSLRVFRKVREEKERENVEREWSRARAMVSLGVLAEGSAPLILLYGPTCTLFSACSG